MTSVQYMTGFQIFAGELRDAVVKEIEEGKGEATDKEVGRRITKRWKDMSEAEKKVRRPAPAAHGAAAHRGCCMDWFGSTLPRRRSIWTRRRRRRCR